MQTDNKPESPRKNRLTITRASTPSPSRNFAGILAPCPPLIDQVRAPPMRVFQSWQPCANAALLFQTSAAAVPNTESMQLKTFIVEDSPVIRENLIATLEELVPIRVVGTAEDEPTAVAWLGSDQNQADLVIVDIFLKSGSGLGVIRHAQRLGKPYIMVVLSNYATEEIRRKCLELGVDRVFDKSNEIDALIDYCAALADSDFRRTTPDSLQ